jgi:hypothetical protein
MSLDQARQAIVDAIEAAKVGSPIDPIVIEYDNRILVDTATASDPFLCVDIKLFAGEQADLSPNPRQRMWGQIHLKAAAKEGAGTADQLRILEHFMTRMQRKKLGPVQTFMAGVGLAMPLKGWSYYPCIVPFYYDNFV